MSNIGFVGLGKLGLPSALAIESKYDLNPNGKKNYPIEQSVPNYFKKLKLVL